jgi:hypothetical protein
MAQFLGRLLISNLQGGETMTASEKSQSLSSDAEAAKDAGTQPPRGDVKEQRGGEQADQISGETQKGAHNQEMKGRNPQGNKANQNQSDRQEDNAS